MQPTTLLSDEHRVIEQVLDCLEKMAAQARAGGQLNLDHARAAVDFFRNFADKCHHGKEEAHLFPMMEAKGFSCESGPTGVMRHEHEEGRAHVRAMSEEIEAAAAGEAEATQRFAFHAGQYIQLLRDHIAKEDHCLFPMANQALSPDDQQALAAKFEHVEHEEMGEGTHEKFLKIANDLAEHYHVALARPAAEGKGCGCHHGHQ